MARTRVRMTPGFEDAQTMESRLDMSTAEIGLSVRTTNCLEECGIYSVRDLLNTTPDRLLAISNFGDKTLEEVYKALESVKFFRDWRRPEQEAVS